MDLALLKLFETVAGEGSFSRAGQRLFRSQPAISLALRRLEDDLGVVLIDRSTRSLRLTDAGRKVSAYTKEFFTLEREMRVALSDLRNRAAGKLTIGANESTALYLLGHVERFRHEHRGIQVELRRSLSSQIPQAVRDGSLELGAISYDPADPNLSLFRLYDDRLTRMLRAIRTEPPLDIRELIVQTQSTDAVHDREIRPRPEEIETLYSIDQTLTEPAPRLVAVVDDLLTTGAHFRAAKSILSARFPEVAAVGMFIARRAPDTADLDEFDDVEF